MEKTIRIDNEHQIKVSNNLSWMIIYKSQFGHDIVPEIMPLIGGFSEMISGLAESGLEFKNAEDLIKKLDKDILTNIFVELTGLEFVAFINVCWAMAKAADPDIDDPMTWIRQYDTFPVDILAPEVFSLVIQGVISSKNWTRLQTQMQSLKSKMDKRQTSSKSLPQE